MFHRLAPSPPGEYWVAAKSYSPGDEKSTGEKLKLFLANSLNNQLSLSE